jgi:hypothetical protein
MMPKIPQFASEQEESEFWDTHDSTNYFDETTEVEMVFVDQRPRVGLVTVPLDRDTVSRLVALANRRKVGYRALLAEWIVERLAAESAADQALPSDVITPVDRLRPAS